MKTELEVLRERVEILRAGVDAAKTEAQRANTIGAHMFLMGLDTALNIMTGAGAMPLIGDPDRLYRIAQETTDEEFGEGTWRDPRR